jgi:hypothetical protein
MKKALMTGVAVVSAFLLQNDSKNAYFANYSGHFWLLACSFLPCLDKLFGFPLHRMANR